ncbi:MAG TPA: guanylate kinase [Desulfobulbaceae bacterium]|nr:MAG: guanylate kinase [Deltaproteobacteria bacterium RIFOXYD12_FULL_53_23]HCC55639.1 guanylate kinase [Desulfobulbaceae bacterium]
MSRGKLFVISAPSGAGKSTLLKRLLIEVPNLAFSVSHTTRAPRPGESNGREYHFVDHPTFTGMCANQAFLEWAEVHGNLYGTSRAAIEAQQAKGIDVFLDIDVQGARQLREQQLPGAIFLFITPPSWTELERRLRGRGTDAEETVQLRLNNARREMEAADLYDYLVINDRLDEAVEVLRAVIIAERCKARRNPDGLPIDWEKVTG